ncbi:uncharacterized protein LOC133175617 [Saccostrea echinata]|uniref:uncharacterized protein LOC133175617 n=1 Tax=Saccostrea echinata TaxID=191078 RepID=UPI002A7EDD1B|nr:uncharacterized protein LOC133175617 [Saccostrea echinata]
MDELTAKLAGSFNVTLEPNSTAAQHPRYALYKSKTRVDQETRRKRILEEQKKQRFDYLKHVRNLSEDAWENTDAESVASEDSMDVSFEGDNVKLRRPGKYYRNQLMYSEWLVEKPEDFEQEWLTVICPWGKRNLVVASRGRTHAYAKNGSRMNSFSSHLPGGNYAQKGKGKGDNVILDCIFDENEGIYYVLDIMCWRNHPVYDSETEFRFFWLTSKFQEVPELMEKSPNNPYKFIPLPNFPCTKESISTAINTATFNIDGLLFFHKRTHYTFGSTPLVVWLKPYMLPEILEIEVPEKLLAERPDNYSNYAAHLEHVAEEKKNREEERNRKGKTPPKGRGGGGGGDWKEKKKKGGRGGGRGGAQTMEVYEDSQPERDPYSKRSYGQDFRMDLMFSEWLTEIPSNLETEWYAVICPTGKRHLVLACEGETISQLKNGILVKSFRSLLPGGFPYEMAHKDMCVVDTIFNKQTDTYYIMDCMIWNNQHLTQCEAEFRMYWLEEQLGQIRNIGRVSRNNQHPFMLLKRIPCTAQALTEELVKVEYDVDGVLFYKKSSAYIPGQTEDVLWIKPYMLPEVMSDVIVPSHLLKRKPPEFDYQKHLEKVTKQKKERGEQKRPQRKQKILNIDKLVDDISRIYISQQQRAGVEMSPEEVEISKRLNQKSKKISQGKGGGKNMGDYSALKKKENITFYGDDFSYENYCNSSYYGDYSYYGDQGYPGVDGYRGDGYHSMSPAGWGYEDHGRQWNSPPKGRGRGLLGLKPLAGYSNTHSTFKK